MPHKDFDALRQELDRAHPDGDPLTFTLFGHLYTCLPAPTLGDSFDLMDAPEPMENEPQAVRALCRFISRLVIEADKQAWHDAQFKLLPHHGPLIIDIGTHLAEQYAGRPTQPPSESSDGRPTTGEKSTSSPDETDGPEAPTP